MNARQLEVFRAVMLTGSLTDAAKLLNVTQPTLSKVLRHSETQHGLKLFETVRGRLVPTREAELLFPLADRVFRDLAGLRRLAAQLRDGRGGVLRLGVSASLGMTVAADAAAAFQSRHPDARLVFHSLPALEIAEKLRTREVDLGLTLSPIVTSSLGVEKLGSVDMAVLLPAGSPLAARSVLRPSDLQNERLISFGSDSHFGQLLDEAFGQDGVERQVSLEVFSGASAVALVARGAGVAIIDRLLAADAGPGTVCRTFRPAIDVPLNLVVSDVQPSPALCRVLVRDLRAAAAARLAAGGAQGLSA